MSLFPTFKRSQLGYLKRSGAANGSKLILMMRLSFLEGPGAFLKNKSDFFGHFCFFRQKVMFCCFFDFFQMVSQSLRRLLQSQKPYKQDFQRSKTSKKVFFGKLKISGKKSRLLDQEGVSPRVGVWGRAAALLQGILGPNRSCCGPRFLTSLQNRNFLGAIRGEAM